MRSTLDSAGLPPRVQRILERVLALLSDDLARRLSPREHALLVACTAAIAGGRARLAGGRWSFDGETLMQPLQLDANDQLQRETAHA